MASPENALSKLADLRKAIVRPNQEDIEQLKAWELSIKKHQMLKKWLEHPISILLHDEILRKATEMSVRLSTDRSLNEADRAALFETKDFATFLLTIFKTGKDDQVIEQIEKELDASLQSWGEYGANYQPGG